MIYEEFDHVQFNEGNNKRCDGLIIKEFSEEEWILEKKFQMFVRNNNDIKCGEDEKDIPGFKIFKIDCFEKNNTEKFMDKDKPISHVCETDIVKKKDLPMKINGKNFKEKLEDWKVIIKELLEEYKNMKKTSEDIETKKNCRYIEELFSPGGALQRIIKKINDEEHLRSLKEIQFLDNPELRN